MPSSTTALFPEVETSNFNVVRSKALPQLMVELVRFCLRRLVLDREVRLPILHVLRKLEVPVALVDDYNVMPTELDIDKPEHV